MGKPKYIYFQDEVHELLSTCENASKLVNKLVKEHFKYEFNNPEDKEKLIAQEQEKYITMINELELKRKKAIDEIDKKREEELLKEEIDQELKKKEKVFIQNIKDTFKEEMGRNMTEEELNRYEKGDDSIWNFCDKLKEDGK